MQDTSLGRPRPHDAVVAAPSCEIQGMSLLGGREGPQWGHCQKGCGRGHCQYRGTGTLLPSWRGWPPGGSLTHLVVTTGFCPLGYTLRMQGQCRAKFQKETASKGVFSAGGACVSGWAAARGLQGKPSPLHRSPLLTLRLSAVSGTQPGSLPHDTPSGPRLSLRRWAPLQSQNQALTGSGLTLGQGWEG